MPTPESWGQCAAPPGTRAYAEWVKRNCELDERGAPAWSMPNGPGPVETRSPAPRRASEPANPPRVTYRTDPGMQAKFAALAHVWDNADEYDLDD